MDTIKLNKNDLDRLIRESVKKTLNEIGIAIVKVDKTPDFDINDDDLECGQDMDCCDMTGDCFCNDCENDVPSAQKQVGYDDAETTDEIGDGPEDEECCFDQDIEDKLMDIFGGLNENKIKNIIVNKAKKDKIHLSENEVKHMVKSIKENIKRHGK